MPNPFEELIPQETENPFAALIPEPESVVPDDTGLLAQIGDAIQDTFNAFGRDAYSEGPPLFARLAFKGLTGGKEATEQVAETWEERKPLWQDMERMRKFGWEYVGSSMAGMMGDINPMYAGVWDHTAQEMRDEAHAMANEEPALDDPNMLQKAFMTGYQSITVSLPMMLFGVATRSPGVAASGFGAVEAMRQYGEDRAMGMPKKQALIHSTISGLIETGTEVGPFKKFADIFGDKMGSSLGARFIKYLGFEVGFENIAEFSQRWNDYFTGGDNPPTGDELKEIAALTTLSTVLTAGAQGGLASGTAATWNALRSKLKQNPELKAAADDLINRYEELDQLHEDGLMDDLSYQEALNKLTPVVHNLLRIAKDDPKLGKLMGVTEETLKRLEGHDDIVGFAETVLKHDPTAGGRALMGDVPDTQPRRMKKTEVEEMGESTDSPLWTFGMAGKNYFMYRDPDGGPGGLRGWYLFEEGQSGAEAEWVGDTKAAALETMRRRLGTTAEDEVVELDEMVPTDDEMDTLRGAQGMPSKEWLEVQRDRKRQDELVYRVTLEAIPSPDLETGKYISGLPFEQQQRYTDRVNEVASIEAIADALGIEVLAINSTGGWMGGVAPNNVVSVRTAEEATKMSRALSFTRQQKAVPWFHASDEVAVIRRRPDGRPILPNGAKEAFFIELEKPLNLSQLRVLSTNLGVKTQAGYTDLGNGRIAVINFDGVADFEELVYQAIEEVPGLADQQNDFELIGFTADESFYEEINWQDAAAEEEVLRATGLTPAQESGLRSWRDQIDAVANEFGFEPGSPELNSEPSWTRWVPFASTFHYRQENGATTLTIQNSEAKQRIFQSIKNLPSLFITSIKQIGYMQGGKPSVSAQYLKGKKIIRIREDELFGPRGPFYLAHEIGHHVSLWEAGEHDAGLATQSQLYVIDLLGNEQGEVMQEAIHVWERGGLLVDEILIEVGKDEMTHGEIHSYMRKDPHRFSVEDQAAVHAFMELEYPFGHLMESISKASKYKGNQRLLDHHLNKKGAKNSAFFKEELFAQQYAMYHHMRNIMEIVMPKAYALFEEINEIATTEIEHGQANSRIRKALRAPGSGLRSEVLNELAEQSGNGLDYEQADQGVRNARERSRRNGRDLFRPGRKLWDALNGTGWFDWYKALGGLPNPEKYIDLRSLTQGTIHRAELLNERLYELLHGLDEETGHNVYRYLTTADANPKDYIDPSIMVTDRRTRKRGKKGKYDAPLWRKAEAVKRLITNMGKELTKVGILENEIYSAHKDEYLPRMYLKHMLGEDGVQRLATKGKLDLNYLKKRKDLTAWEKEIFLGQIFDPAFLVPMTMGRTMRDVALHRFLQQIQQNEKWVSPASLMEWEIPGEFHREDNPEFGVAAGDPVTMSVTPQWLMHEGERILNTVQKYPQRLQRDARLAGTAMIKAAQEKLKDQEFDTKNFTLIPDSPMYGALRGAWVRKEIANDLRGALKIEITGTGWLDKAIGFERLASLQSAWKLNRVALNPPTVARNIWSNLMLMQIIGGMPMFTSVKYNPIKMMFSDSVSEMYNKGKYYRIALKYGIAKSSFSDSELLKIRREWERIAEDGGPIKDSLGKAHKMARVIAEFGGNSYQTIEMMGKIAVIKYKMEQEGMSAREAVREANNALFDYSLVPQWVEFLRKYPIGWPFITFQYKVIPALTEVFATNPQRYLPWAALYFGWKMAIPLALDADDEELDRARLALPEWLRDNPGLLPMPFKDDEGHIQFFDISYIFPWSMPFSFAKQIGAGKPVDAFKETGIAGGPLLDISAGLKTNKHPFYGKEIWNDDDPAVTKAVKAIEYVWNSYAPGILTTLSSNPPVKWWEAHKGRSSIYNDPPTKTEAWARLFGINMHTVDPEGAQTNLYYMMLEQDKYVEAKMREADKEPHRRREIMAEMRDRMVDLTARIVDYRVELGDITPEEAEEIKKRSEERAKEKE